jgi:hypothetical protein
MAIKKEAAYHEAAHALIAHRSTFHNFLGPINLAEYGAGEAFVSLSNSKLASAGKPISPDPAKDVDVIRDLAEVLVAGYVVEQIAAEKDSSLKPNAECAKPDHDLLQQQLAAAGLSKKYDRFQTQAKASLEKEWPLVEKLAAFLLKKVTASGLEVREFIEAAAKHDASADV